MSDNQSRNGDFWSPKTVEQLAAEQGVAPITNAAQVFGHGRDLWDSDEEFEAFVAGIQARRAEGLRDEGEAQPGAA